MKTKSLFIAAVLITGIWSSVSAQGLLNINNSGQLISAGGSLMPRQTSFETTFYFGLFLAPPNTDIVSGPFDPNWATPVVYATNHTAVSGEGRIISQNLVNTGWPAGSTADILVRGWSANLGATWLEASQNLAYAGLVPGYYYGQSVVGQNIQVNDGTSLPVFNIFGPGPNQVQGFNLIGIPEPSALSLVGLGMVASRFLRRRR